MALSPHTTRLFVRLVASALAAAAIAAPTALPAGSPDAFERAVNRHLATDTASPSGLISENSASQNRVASSLPHGLRSDNSASQNRLDRISTPQDRLISENSASQNRVAAAQRDYGPPDPWLYPYMHNGTLIGRNSASSLPHGLRSDNSASQNRLDRISTPQDRLISENSASQNRLVQSAPSPTAVASAPTNGFDWRDAAVGAGSTLALTLLAIGAAVAVRRTRAGVAAWH